MLFHSMTFGVKERERERGREDVFLKLSNGFLIFDEIFGGVCFCGVFFRELYQVQYFC